MTCHGVLFSKLLCCLYQSTGKAINDHPPLELLNSQSPQLSHGRPFSEALAMLSSHVTPTKSAVQESRIESFHASPTKQATKTMEADNKKTEKPVSGSEDILDVLASRIDQLAASDSEDDIFGGMFCLIL